MPLPTLPHRHVRRRRLRNRALALTAGLLAAAAAMVGWAARAG